MRKFSKILCAIMCTGIISSASVPVIKAESLELTSGTIEYEFIQDLRDIADRYILHYPECADIIEHEYECYLNDEMLISSYCVSKNDATDTFETALKISLRNETQEIVGLYNMTPTAGDRLFYCDVDTTIVQQQTTWCGVAATQMALTGIQNCSSSNLISGFTLPSQTDIANSVCNESGEAVVANVRTFLNNKLKTTAYKYTYKQISDSVDAEEVGNYIRNSLYINRPVILHAKPYSAFDYYSGVTYTN